MKRAKTRDSNPSENIKVAANAISAGAAVLRVTAEKLEGCDDETADTLWRTARSVKRIKISLQRLAEEKAERS